MIVSADHNVCGVRQPYPPCFCTVTLCVVHLPKILDGDRSIICGPCAHTDGHGLLELLFSIRKPSHREVEFSECITGDSSGGVMFTNCAEFKIESPTLCTDIIALIREPKSFITYVSRQRWGWYASARP